MPGDARVQNALRTVYRVLVTGTDATHGGATSSTDTTPPTAHA